MTTAFTTLGQLFSNTSYLAGGLSGSLSNAYPACVDKVFPKPAAQPQAAMVFEGDFVVSEITGNSSNYAPGTTGTGGAACTADRRQDPVLRLLRRSPPRRRTAPTTPPSRVRATSAMMLNADPAGHRR